MIYSTMTHKSLSFEKLQISLENIQSQLKLERASSQAKDNRFKSLEDLVIEVGYNPTDIKAAEELTKKKKTKKNVGIATLKKQLKLPTTKHPQTKEVLEKDNQKDEMMNLIIQLTAQLKEM